MQLPPGLDWQGHRGARGLVPENSIASMLAAADLGVTTLEMDVVITRDSQVVLSHEPWLSHEICRDIRNKPIDPASEQQLHALYRMSYDEFRYCDCGSWGHPRFPTQRKMRVSKPRLGDVLVAMREWEALNPGRKLNYNIETKITPEWEAAGLTPSPAEFVRMLLRELELLGIAERTTIQSFDVRTLQEARRQGFQHSIALLVENANGYEANLKALGFKPDIYSPHFPLVSPQLVAACHRDSIRVIPWTVNEVADMQRLIDMGVDGLISDYPDRYAALKIDNRE